MGSKRAIVALARGGVYSDTAAAAMEHAETRLRAMLGLSGITDPEFIIAEGIAIGPGQREKSLSGALGQAARIEPVALAA